VFPASFGYHRASSLADAQRLLTAHPGAKLLAGGHSLLPLLKLRLTAPEALIDIGRVPELKGIRVAPGGLAIGALTTHAEIAASPLVRDTCRVLANTAAQIGDPAVRNRGTIGGSVAHADPAADFPTVLTALGARFEIAGPAGRRTVDAADFFLGMMTTALADNEILTSIGVTAVAGGRGAAYVKFAHPASRYAVIGAAAVLDSSEGLCTGARVVVGGLVPTPVRLASVEAALAGKRLSPDVIKAAAAQSASDIDTDGLGDVFASAEYRRAVAHVYVERALKVAAGL
jgi:carbon-monoxide dehydrogenase medium subunit